MMRRKKIIHHTIKVGAYTLLSRVFGTIRELLMGRFLGAGMLSDAFLTAFKFPNSLRKIFADGAASAVFVPAFTHQVACHRASSIAGMITLALICTEGIVLLLCAIVMMFSPFITWLMASGFSPEQQAIAATFLRILMPFIFFISSSALLASALQSVHHFLIPAIAPVLFNIVLIIGLSCCLYFGLSVNIFCYIVLISGAVQFFAHLIAYLRLNFGFSLPTAQNWQELKPLMLRFMPALLSASLIEINLFIDNSISSFLEPGSFTLIYLGNRFMGIPQGVFAVALSTILLPYFSRITAYAPKRMGYLFLEAGKLVAWITIPTACVMMLFAQDIFVTLFVSEKFAYEKAIIGSRVLCIFLTGLFFFSFNKIVLNAYYAFKINTIPAYVTIGAALGNIILSLTLRPLFGTYGIACATVVSFVAQTSLLSFLLPRYTPIVCYYALFAQSVARIIMQTTCIFPFLYVLYYIGSNAISAYCSPYWQYLLLKTMLLWVWTGPIIALTAIIILATRNWFGIRITYLD